MSVKAAALTIFAASLFNVIPVQAGEAERPRHSVSAGLAAADFDYKEADEGDRLNHEDGVLPGLTLKWQFLDTNYLAGAELTWFKGDVDYEGATQAGSLVSSITDVAIWRGSISAGWRYEQSPSIEYQALAGIGYREWQRDIRSTASASGLMETYTFWFGSIGFRTLYRPSDQHLWSLRVSANRPLSPEVKVVFENELDTARLDLGEATTLDIALSWHYRFATNLGLETELFHRSWELGRSAEQVLTQNEVPVGTVFEPASETSTAGFAVKIIKWF